jgi:hypothetical protein
MSGVYISTNYTFVTPQNILTKDCDSTEMKAVIGKISELGEYRVY